MTDSDETQVPCRDVAGRDGFVRVFLNADKDIVIKVPPGEAGILRPRDVYALREVLRVYGAEGERLQGGVS